MSHSLQNTIRASHIAIGTELTSGQTLNTNSRFIAEHLMAEGIKNQLHIVVPDEKNLILQCFDFISPQSDWIFVYGGLGPTTDDFTRNIVSEWTNKDLRLNESVWQHIQNILNGRGYPVREFQKQQALFPESAQIMENSKGTAHGFHVSAKGKEVFVVPGPPKEVHSVFENYLKNWIRENARTADAQITKIWNTLGLGESEVAYQIENLIKDYNVVVGYRVHLPYVEVKISYLKSQQEQNRTLVDAIDQTLRPIQIYSHKYPYPEFFKSFFQDYVAISLVDEVTQGLILNDFKQWSSDWETKQIAYYNQSAACVFTRSNTLRALPTPTGHLLFSITHDKERQCIPVLLSSQKLNLKFEIPIHTLAKMPIERQPLFIKEMIYKSLTSETLR
ncbi:MAG: hypothetical protein JNL11_06250 [Bdellovibrionaceae bacterium]|nr:hypothetical protein [Pseudobdellovibrionaceae bacterium]